MDQVKKSRIIYHYTDGNGAKGIIESQALWLTHYMYLNDSNELTIFKEAVAEWVKNISDSRIIDGLCKILFEDFFGKQNDNTEKIPYSEGYIASFCDDEGDRLSQWRAYGKGHGYAIGFDEAELKIWLEKNPFWKKRSFMTDVSYGNILTLPKDIADDLERYAYLINPLKHMEEMKVYPDPTKVRISMYEEAIKLFSHCLCRFKDEGFSEEKEVRIMLVVPISTVEKKNEDDKQGKSFIKFRSVRGNLVPYVELSQESCRLPIKQIIVGPSPNVKLREKAMQILLETNGMNPEIVKISHILYGEM